MTSTSNHGTQVICESQAGRALTLGPPQTSEGVPPQNIPKITELSGSTSVQAPCNARRFGPDSSNSSVFSFGAAPTASISQQAIPVPPPSSVPSSSALTLASSHILALLTIALSTGNAQPFGRDSTESSVFSFGAAATPSNSPQAILGFPPASVPSSSNVTPFGRDFTESSVFSFGAAATPSISQQASPALLRGSVPSSSGTPPAIHTPSAEPYSLSKPVIDQRGQPATHNATVTASAPMRSPSISAPTQQSIASNSTSDTTTPTQSTSASNATIRSPSGAQSAGQNPSLNKTVNTNSVGPQGSLASRPPQNVASINSNSASAPAQTAAAPATLAPSTTHPINRSAKRRTYKVRLPSSNPCAIPPDQNLTTPGRLDSEQWDQDAAMYSHLIEFVKNTPLPPDLPFPRTTNQSGSTSTSATALWQGSSCMNPFTALSAQKSGFASPKQSTDNGTDSTASVTLTANGTSRQESATTPLPIFPRNALISQNAVTSPSNAESVKPVRGTLETDVDPALNINASASGSSLPRQIRPIPIDTFLLMNFVPVNGHATASTISTTPMQSSSAIPLPPSNATSRPVMSKTAPAADSSAPINTFNFRVSDFSRFRSIGAQTESSGAGHVDTTTTPTSTASPALTAEHIPVTLLNRIFGELVDNVHNHVPTELEHTFRAALSLAMSAPNTSMLVDSAASLDIFTKLVDEQFGIKFTAEVPGKTAMLSRRALVNNHPYIMIDIGWPSPFTNPFAPNMDAYQRYIDSLSDDPSTLPALPCLHILFHGTSLSIAGSVMASGTHRFEVLTSDIPLSHHDLYDESVRNQTALTFGAMANAAKKLKDLYSGDILRSRVLQAPYQISYGHLDTNLQVSLVLDELVKEGKLEYYGREDYSTPVVVRFVRRFCQDLPGSCLSLGCAPHLRGVEKLPGGWVMVVTDRDRWPAHEFNPKPPKSAIGVLQAASPSAECDVKIVSDAMTLRRSFVSMSGIIFAMVQCLCWTQLGVGM